MPYNALRLDELDDGSAIQEYLYQKTGQRTVPNVFVGEYSKCAIIELSPYDCHKASKHIGGQSFEPMKPIFSDVIFTGNDDTQGLFKQGELKKLITGAA